MNAVYFVMGSLTLFASVVSFGLAFGILGKAKAVATPAAQASPVATDEKPKRWVYRFVGFAAEFKPIGIQTPTTVRFRLDDGVERVEPEDVEAKYRVEGDDFVVFSDEPYLKRFMDTHYGKTKMMIIFDYTLELSPGNVTTGSDFLLHTPKPRSEASGTAEGEKP